MTCDLDLTDDELAAMDWLAGVLSKIRARGRSHPSYERAVAAERALDKIHDFCEGAHEKLRALSAAHDEIVRFALEEGIVERPEAKA